MEMYGSQAEQAAFSAQLEAIYYKMPDSVMAGSVARAVVYNAYNYADAPAFALANRAEPSGYRDLDMVFASGGEALLYGRSRTSPELHHRIDPAIGSFIRRDGENVELYGLNEGNQEVFIPVEPAVFTPVTRQFMGAPVRTFAIGTQLQMVRMLLEGYGANQKLVVAAAQLGTFALEMHERAPDEFLPAEYYAPFQEFKDQRLT